MRRVILIVILTGAIVLTSNAQDYKTGVGLRIGTGSGFTIKHFLNERYALEGLLTTKWRGFDFTGLFEINHRAFDTDNLVWYYGFGAHIGLYNGSDVEWGSPGSTYDVFGIDGIIGLEYSFDEAPINIGIDIKPLINFTGYTGYSTDFGLSVRYVF